MKENIATKQRNSNIEWLRIISMLLIIAFHMERSFEELSGSFIVNATTIALGKWGLLGVDLFLIISAKLQPKHDSVISGAVLSVTL